MKCCEIKIGSLRNLVTVERETLTVDDAGGNSVTWEVVGQHYADIRLLSAYERFAQGRIESGATHKFTFRYFAGLLPTDRLSFAGVLYNIRGIDNLEMRNRFLIVTAERGVTQ